MKQKEVMLLGALFLFFLLLRFFALSADPLFIKRLGDVSDEGYWAHNSRNMVLFGGWLQDDLAQGIALAPLYALFLFFSFSFFGVSYFSMRLINALFGFLSIVLFYFFIKRHKGQKSALHAVLLLGFSLTFLAYNRLALVETFLGFWTLLAFFLWGEKKYFFSGIAMSLAILAKITGVYFLLAFLILLFFDFLRAKKELKAVFREAALFCFGLLPGAATYFWLYSLDKRLPLTLFSLGGVYNPVAFFAKHLFAVLGNSLFAKIDFFLIMLLVFVYFLHALQQRRAIEQMGFIEYSAIAWLFGGAIGICLTDFADRRFLVLIFPLIFLATEGLKAKRIEFSKAVQYVSERKWLGPGGLFFSSLLVFSLLSFFNPLFVTAFDSYYSIVALVFAGLLFLFVLFLHRSLRLIAFCLFLFIAVPLFYVPVVIAAEAFNIFSIPIALKFGWKAALLLLALLLAVFYKKVALTQKFAKTVLIAFVAINLVMTAIAFSTLSFSVQQASQQLDSVVAKGEIVAGTVPHYLSLENSCLPVVFNKMQMYSKINRNTVPDFFLVTVRADGMNTATNYDETHFRETKFIKDIYLLPIAFSQHYRMHLRLYCVSNERRKC